MNKSLIIRLTLRVLFLLCLPVLVSRSQEKIKILDLNFKEKKFSHDSQKRLQSLKQGDFFQIEISNLNLNLYKVVIGKTDSVVSKEITLPGFGNFAVDAITKLTSLLLPIGGATGTTAPPTLVPDIVPKPLAQKEKDAIKFIDTIQKEAKEQFEELIKVRKSIDSLVFTYNKYFVKSFAEFDLTGFDISKLSLTDLYSSTNEYRSQLWSLRDKLNTLSDEYKSGLIEHSKAISKNPKLRSDSAMVQKILKEFSTTLTNAQQSVSADSTLNYFKSIAFAMNNSNNTYRSLPFQFTKEQTTLDIKIEPRFSESPLQSFNTQLIFPIQQKEFWGVSSGFYYSWVRNEAYSIKQNVSSSKDTSFSIVNEDVAKGEFGLNAMFRYGHRICDGLYVQAGVGPAISIADKVRPRLMVVLGLAYGGKQKILVDMGLSLGYSDRRSAMFNPDSTYDTSTGSNN